MSSRLVKIVEFSHLGEFYSFDREDKGYGKRNTQNEVTVSAVSVNERMNTLEQKMEQSHPLHWMHCFCHFFMPCHKLLRRYHNKIGLRRLMVENLLLKTLDNDEFYIYIGE